MIHSPLLWRCFCKALSCCMLVVDALWLRSFTWVDQGAIPLRKSLALTSSQSKNRQTTYHDTWATRRQGFQSQTRMCVQTDWWRDCHVLPCPCPWKLQHHLAQGYVQLPSWSWHHCQGTRGWVVEARKSHLTCKLRVSVYLSCSHCVNLKFDDPAYLGV